MDEELVPVLRASPDPLWRTPSSKGDISQSLIARRPYTTRVGVRMGASKLGNEAPGGKAPV